MKGPSGGGVRDTPDAARVTQPDVAFGPTGCHGTERQPPAESETQGNEGLSAKGQEIQAVGAMQI